ncbi:MAG TPA: S8 family serine peptidase [Pseudosphingobacterium sp.]|nr:S8 family serine peptidase [Pseudosphingobacterium sp.]
MNTQIKIYKSLGAKPSIYVEVNGEDATLELELYLDSNLLERVSNKSTNHLFRIEKSGKYGVSAKSNNITLRSNEIVFYDHDLQPLKERYPVIDYGEGFYIEIKIKKGAASLLENKVNKLKRNVSLTAKPINTASFPSWHSIHDFEYYVIRQGLGRAEVNEFCLQLENMDYVEYCAPAPVVDNLLPPFIEGVDKSKSVYDDSANDNTPDYSMLQGYLDEPKGMNIRNVWQSDNTGQLAVIRHLDFGVYKDHEDFQEGNIIVVTNRLETEDCNHGTASVGCISAGKNSFGVAGIAHSSLLYFYNTGDLNKIVEQANPGDIVSLDIQWNTQHGYIPAIGIRSWWDKIKILTEKQVIVIMAAGNGNNDLSNTTICPDYGESGGILVGACKSADGRRRSSSNYGHYTFTINSWGENVTTAGYGRLQDKPGYNRDYTHTYSGTSSATPLCAGALALLQSHAKRRGILLTPETMKLVLESSNYTEGEVDGIGKRPNVEQLIGVIDHLFFPGPGNNNPNNNRRQPRPL